MNNVGNAVVCYLEELKDKDASQVTSGIKNMTSGTDSMIGSLIKAVEKINEDNAKYVKGIKVRTGVTMLVSGIIIGVTGGVILGQKHMREKEEKRRRVEEAKEYLDNLNLEYAKNKTKIEEKNAEEE